MLHFKVQLLDAQLTKREELDVMSAWNSTYRNGNDGFHTVAMDWEDKTTGKSKVFSISMPIKEGESRRLPSDGRAWFEMLSKGDNDGRMSRMRNGSTFVTYKELNESVKNTGEYSQTLDLRVSQLQVRENNETTGFYKGKLKIELANPEDVKHWSFSPIGKYDFVPENEERIMNLLGSWVNSSIGLKMTPIAEPLKNIDFPVWNDVVANVGDTYVLSSTVSEPDEPYFQNLASITFDAHNVDTDWFLSVSENQFKDLSVVDKDFVLVTALTAATGSAFSWSLAYMPDKTYVIGANSLGVQSTETKDTEAFSYASNLMTGDCEDLDHENRKHFLQLKAGRKELANKKNYWTVEGGWEDKRLQVMQRILHHYVPVLVLTSVTSAKVERAGTERVKIGSVEDKRAPIGAHMYCKLMPEDLFIKLLSKTGNAPKMNINGNSRFGPAKKDIPNLNILISEGTGAVFPPPLPIGEYYPRGEEKTTMMKIHEKRIKGYHILVPKGSLWECGTNIAWPEFTVDEVGSRISDFYRQPIHIYTDEPYKRWGIKALKFEAVTRSQNSSEWNLGFDVRDLVVSDKVYKEEDDTRRCENIGLIPTGHFTEEQMMAAKSVLNQVPVHKTFSLSPKLIENIKNERWARAYLVGEPEQKNKTTSEIMINFQRHVDSVLRNRIAPKSADDIETISVFFKQSDLITGSFTNKNGPPMTLREGLLKEMAANPNILSAKFEIQPIAGSENDPISSTVFRINAKVCVSLKNVAQPSIGKSYHRTPDSGFVASVFLENQKNPVEIHLRNQENAREFVEIMRPNIGLEWNKIMAPTKGQTHFISLRKKLEKTGGKIADIEFEDTPAIEAGFVFRPHGDTDFANIECGEGKKTKCGKKQKSKSKKEKKEK